MITTIKDISMNNMQELIDILRTLRGSNGCPWDKKQTHKSLKPLLVEECSELLDAIDNEDDHNIMEELGDILMHIVFHSQIGEEENRFTFDDVTKYINDKMIRRHPHIFSDELKIQNSEDVVLQWEDIKKKEKKKLGREHTSTLDGTPKNLPALTRADEIQRKASSIGFDWTDSKDIVNKIDEELKELKFAITSEDSKEIDEETGDLLFTLVNYCRHRGGHSAEYLLQRATDKFETRFRLVEGAMSNNKQKKDYTLSELDELWERAKESLK